jgi:hypothetical protein
MRKWIADVFKGPNKRFNFVIGLFTLSIADRMLSIANGVTANLKRGWISIILFANSIDKRA